MPHSYNLHRGGLRAPCELVVLWLPIHAPPSFAQSFTPASDNPLRIPLKPCILDFTFRTPHIPSSFPMEMSTGDSPATHGLPASSLENQHLEGRVQCIVLPMIHSVGSLCVLQDVYFRERWRPSRRAPEKRRQEGRGGSSSRKQSPNPVAQSRLTAFLFEKRR